jgi:tetratricopeptide (TPR) repeat protein
MYSPRQVAELVGVPESRIRYWAQTGLVGPTERSQGRIVYNFQDLVAVKAAKELVDAGVSPQRVRRSLEALRPQLPGVQQPLAALRLVGDGDRVVVVRDGARYEPLSGQLLLDLDVGALAARVAGELRALPEESAWTAFAEGLRRESQGELDAARAHYRRALELDPQLAAAETNLGQIDWAVGDKPAARLRWEKALELDPGQPEARFNLGNWYDDAGDRARALIEWCAAIAVDDSFAEAHFHVGLALSESGAHEAAAPHLSRYLALSPDGEGAARARLLIEKASSAGPHSSGERT